ncbi:MAG: exodeoxyribonuclease III [Patescibacteria group bacterium]|nr:exodeoxyribonuclease III [Patescibacteria group bacterium]
MKIFSWNVNGIRAVVKKGFTDFLKKERPDILCLQEIKISADARNKEIFDFAGYQEFWHSALRPGYSGTMTLVKDDLVIAKSGNSQVLTHPVSRGSDSRKPTPSGQGPSTPPEEGNSHPSREGNKLIGLIDFPDDPEGRVQILEFAKFYLANVYFPNANHELSRLDFKLKFNDRLLKFLKKLEKTKPLVVCGDYNVAHEPIDLFHPKENEGNAGYTEEERDWMTKFLKAGFVDTFRAQNPNKAQYSWWSFRMNVRARNIGWRIDYFCVSWYLFKSVKSSFIMDKIQGSDHCPVGIELK